MQFLLFNLQHIIFLLLKWVSIFVPTHFFKIWIVSMAAIKINNFRCQIHSCLPFRAWAAQWVRSLDLTNHTSLSPIRCGFAPGFVNCRKGCTRLAATCDKVYQLLAHGRWVVLSSGTPASSTTKTGRHDITEIIVESGVKTPKIKIIYLSLSLKNNILELIIIWEDEENTYKYNQMILCRGLQSIMLYLKLTEYWI